MTRIRIRFGPKSKNEDIKSTVTAGVALIHESDSGRRRGARLADVISRRLHGNNPQDDLSDTPRSLLHQRLQFLRSLIVRILYCLDHVGLDRIKEEFLCQPSHELSIVQFVSLMVRVTCESDNELLSSEVDVNDVAQALAELFDIMDLNGNHTIEFSEFLETCIHWGLSAGGGIDSRQILDDPIPPFSAGPHSRIDPRATKKYLIYLDILDQVLIFEPIARKLLIMDPDYMKVTRTLIIGEKTATAVEYIHGGSEGITHRLTAVAFFRHIILYEGLLSGRFLERNRIPIRVKLFCLRWMQNADLLLGGGSNGNLFVWDLEGHLVQTVKGHSAAISSMIIVPGSHTVLTGSADRTIRQRDLECAGRSEKFTYSGHTGAVTCLALNNDRTEFVSGSSTGELFVWSLIDSHVLHTIAGHSRPIAFAAFVNDSPEFVSADETGHYRIWDSRLAFSNVETIQVGSMGFNHSGSTICTKRDTRILVPSDFDVFSWDQQTQRNGRRRKREITYHMEETLIFGEYLEASCLFVTATNRTIRFWNALTGCLKEQYDNIMDDYDITAICFDTTSRKMIIGDHRGRIHVFNAMSGKAMKKLVPHSSEILSLHYVVIETERLVISLSRDGHLRSHDESPIQHCPVRLDVQLGAMGFQEVTVLSASSNLGMAAVGDHVGRVSVWNMSTNRISETIHGTGLVSAIEFIGSYPLLAVANGTPMISIYALEPSVQHGSCLLTIDNLTADILTAAFVTDLQLLYVADATGFISGFDISLLMDQHHIHPVTRHDQSDHHSDRLKIRKPKPRILTIKQLISQAQTIAAHGVPRTVKFEAGSTAITQIGVISDPHSLFIVSFDPHLTIWSTNGNKLGTLGTLDICRRSVQRRDWKFQVNTGKRLQRADAVAQHVLQSVNIRQTSTEWHDQDLRHSRTFLTQRSASTINLNARNNVALGHQHSRLPGELLKASIYEKDGGPLTREQRQDVRRRRKNAGIHAGLFSQEWRKTSTGSPEWRQASLEPQEWRKTSLDSQTNSKSTSRRSSLTTSRSELQLLDPDKTRRRTLEDALSKTVLQ